MSDLDVFFDQFAVSVTCGGATFKAIFDMPDDLLAGGTVISTEYLLLCKSSDVLSLEPDQSLSIDGEEYTIRSIRKVDDGKLSRVSLSKS